MVQKMFVLSRSSSWTILLLYVITLTLPCGSNSQNYKVPAHIYTDLAKSVKITASHTCNMNGTGFYCEAITCPPSSRTSLTPKLQITQDKIPEECRNSGASLPSHVQSSDSVIYINNSLVSNCTIAESAATSISNSEFSLSLWIKQTCGTCDILELNNGTTVNFKLSLSGNHIRIGSITYLRSTTVSQGNWHHILIRKTAFFIDGKKIANPSLPLTTVGTLEIRSGSLSRSAYLYIADVKLYDHRVTDREIQLLKNGQLAPQLLDTECRCPNDYPELNDPNDPQGILCKKDISVETIRRLNMLSHTAGFANDGDSSTSWISGQTDTARLTLYLDNVVQIKNISITLGSQPRQTTIDMSLPAHTRRFILSSANITNNQLKIDLSNELLAIDNRLKLEDTLAERIDITFSGHSDGKNYFEVSEIDITGRCNCYGNSDTCVRAPQRKFTCQTCNSNNTYTTGSACEKCNTGFYREPAEFDCGNACLCNTEGSIGSNIQDCQEVGGQCHCKANVVGRNCTECKHLTYNFDVNSIEGCTNCSCDPYGSKSCHSNTGVCMCKNNDHYDTSVSDCSKCKPEFYGRQKMDGCEPCNCNISGVVDNNKTCHEFNGDCYCKRYVKGMKCDLCKDGYYGLDLIKSSGCSPCICNTVGSINQTCDKTTGQCHCRNSIQGDSNCNPTISTLEPKYGPIAGGTVVEVKGTLFGNNKSVVDVFYKISPGNTHAFTLISVNDTKLVFQTVPLSAVSSGEIVIRWMSSLRTTGESSKKDKQLTYRFDIKPNPKVTKATAIKTFKSFSCGISIEGSSLDSIYKPRLVVYLLNGDRQEKVCNKVTSTELKCGVPNLTAASNNDILTYGLVLDGLQMYSNLTSMFSGATINVLEDPKIVSTSLEFRQVFMKTITIKGSGFKKACSKSDFKVKIGDDINCFIIDFTDTDITCKPEVKFPGVNTEEDLMLYIGDKAYTVGKITLVMFWSTIEFIGIAVGVGAFILLLIILIVVIKCCCCRKDKEQKNFDDLTADSVENNPILTNMINFDIPLNNMENSDASYDNDGCYVPLEEAKPRVTSRYTTMQTPGNGKPSDTENDSNAVEEFLQRLDSSVRGQLELSLIKKTDVEVERRCTKKGSEIRIIDGKYSSRKATMKSLIKKLSLYKSSEPFYKLMQTGLSECLRLRDCFHDNILQIYGVSVDQDSFYIIYPTTRRLLKDHLNDIKGQTFQVVDLVRMCREVGEGMAFLDKENIVHKDIATRNCFVTDDGTVKICDASFSWDLFPKEYMYDTKKERYLPVRWMAPECLQSSFYDKKTDVWSFGVLMWEMMSRSIGLPYWDVKDDERISTHVTDGNRLGKPANTPENMYQLMLNCWQHDSNFRPDIDSIVNQLVMIENPQDFESSGLYQNLDHGSGAPPSLPPRSDQIYGNIP